MNRLFLFPIIAILVSVNVVNAQRFGEVNIETINVSDQVYTLTGACGNIGMSIGEDAVFVIDDQFAPLSEKIHNAIKAFSDRDMTFLVNTHHHGDHTGGNENMQKLGATIIAHDNVRQRMAKTPKPDSTLETKAALPILTFNDELSLYINE